MRSLWGCPSPLSTPQFHPKTEVRTVFNIVLGKKIPSVPVKKAWRDEWMDRQMGGGHGESKWANEGWKLCPWSSAPPPSSIRTGTTFCLCTSASSVKREKVAVDQNVRNTRGFTHFYKLCLYVITKKWNLEVRRWRTDIRVKSISLVLSTFHRYVLLPSGKNHVSE